MKLNIKIVGQTGTGKTTVARLIASDLQSRGFTVTLQDDEDNKPNEHPLPHSLTKLNSLKPVLDISIQTFQEQSSKCQ